MQNFEIHHISESSLNMYKKCFDENGSLKKIENIKCLNYLLTIKKYYLIT